MGKPRVYTTDNRSEYASKYGRDKLHLESKKAIVKRQTNNVSFSH